MASPGVFSSPNVLAVLKGLDPDIEEILASSGHVSLYTMPVESQQWSRKNIEGSLFLLKRRGSPRFRMMVLNRHSTENYIEDIHCGLDFELNPPYLMYTHGNSEIIGVWFYEQEDLQRVESVLVRIMHANQASQPDAVVRSHSATRQYGSVADENFYDKPSARPTPANVQQQQQPQPQQVGPQLSGAPAAASDGANILATLLRNAELKQQQQQQKQPAAADHAQTVSPNSSETRKLPPPLPPSFFLSATQQQQQKQSVPTTAAPQQAAAATAPLLQAVSALHLQPPVSQVLVSAPSASEQQAPSGGQMPGPLAKLFANAHKAPQASSQAASPLPPPAVPPPAAPAAASTPVVHQPQQQPAAAAGGVSDEERVRRLLARITTNDALVKLLAGEMRAVGLM